MAGEGYVLSETRLRDCSKNVVTIISNATNDAAIQGLRGLIQDLLTTAHTTDIPLAHRSAAVNAVCALLDQCSIAPIEQIRSIVLAEGVWTRALQIFLTRSEEHKSKPLRRLLETLTRLLDIQLSCSARADLIERAVSMCIKAIAGLEDSVAVKPSIQILEYFLRIRIIEATFVVSRWWSCGADDTATSRDCADSFEIASVAQHFTFRLLGWVEYRDCVPAITRFLAVFCQSLQSAENEQNNIEGRHRYSLWLQPIKRYLSDHPERLEVLEDHIIPALLLVDQHGTTALLKMLPTDSIHAGRAGAFSDVEVHLCLVAARAATKKRLPGYDTSADEEDTVNLIALSLSLLDHASASVRLSAFSTIVAIIQSLDFLDDRIISRLQECIPYFHQETSPQPRNKFIALMSKLCSRLRKLGSGVMNEGYNATAVGSNMKSQNDVLEGRRPSLWDWYMDFLIKELRPTGTYQGHITALTVLRDLTLGVSENFRLETMLKWSRDEPEACKRSNNTLSRVLLDLMFDPFDDVREVASTLAHTTVRMELLFRELYAPVEATQGLSGKTDAALSIISDIMDTIPKAKSLFHRTSRASHADGLARLLTLASSARRHSVSPYSSVHMYQSIEVEVRQDIAFAKGSFTSAIVRAPLQASVMALRYIISRPQMCCSDSSRSDYVSSLEFSKVIPELCNEIWLLVRPLLCADAPEGSNPSDDTAAGLEDDKEALSSCWRALKESSLLVQATILRYDNCQNWEATEYKDVYIRLGEMVFEQLAQLRHRGAFSTVSQTFAAWCALCSKSRDEEIVELPKLFYERILELIGQKSNALTRRSAGLPALVTGILSAYTEHSFFDDVLSDLLSMAKYDARSLSSAEGQPLPQVHALNCLKEILIASRFGACTETYIPKVLDLALECLNCEVWAIRNSGLMLLRALLTRLNGGTDTSSTSAPSSHRRSSKYVYRKFGNLPTVLKSLLCDREGPQHSQDVNPTSRAQKVFAALEIVERFGLPNAHEHEIEDAILGHLAGSSWPLREKAAKALSSNIGISDTVQKSRHLLALDTCTQNFLHGKLLCLKWLLRCNLTALRKHAPHGIPTVVSLLDASFDKVVMMNTCPVTAAAFLDIVSDLVDDYSNSITGTDDASRLACKAYRGLVEAYDPILTEIMKDIDASPHTTLLTLSLQRCKKRFDKITPTRRDLHRDTSTFSDPLYLPQSSEQYEEHLQGVGKKLCYQLQEPYVYGPETSMVIVQCIRRLLLACTEVTIKPPWGNGSASCISHPFEVSSRLAAIKSLQQVIRALSAPYHTIQGIKTDILRLYLLLYESMNDDDEDVRNEGAKALCVFLSGLDVQTSSTGMLSLSPPAARSRLLQWLMHEYRRSESFWAHALVRSVGCQPQFCIEKTFGPHESVEASFPSDALECKRILDMQQRSERELLELGKVTKTTRSPIFEEEKQNLYLDPVREACIWTQILTRLPFSRISNFSLVVSQEYLAGSRVNLAAFQEILEDIHADGALSLCSDADFYFLVFRILHGPILCRNPVIKSELDLRRQDRKQYLKDTMDYIWFECSKRRLHGLLSDTVDEAWKVADCLNTE